jgi:hypothetical protein
MPYIRITPTELMTSDASCPTDGERCPDCTADTANDAEQDDECKQLPAVAARQFPASTNRLDRTGVFDSDDKHCELEAHGEEQTGNEEEREPDRDRHSEDDADDERGQERTAEAPGEPLSGERRERSEIPRQQPGSREKHADTEQQRSEAQCRCYFRR